MHAVAQQEYHTVSRTSWGISLLGWLLCSLLAIVIYQWVERPDLRCWEGTKTHGSPAVRAVALTFDDGPHPLWAPLLADTLERHDARGTFFLVGVEAQRYPEMTARLVRAGHQVGSHSMTHPYPNLTALPALQIAREVRQASQILQQIVGQPVYDFRPPGGGVNDTLISVLKHDGLRMAWWSENVGDWSSPTPEVTAQRLRHALRPGLVVLMHERENSVAALERFLAVRGREDYTYTTFAAVVR
ncbi:MAG TPA: polysaccharide deacetylase family protein [Armatimonadota bacterium]|jgi:peptidoglycan/xylan/chitin deacetylase (PgdA/CDA1 family)